MPLLGPPPQEGVLAMTLAKKPQLEVTDKRNDIDLQVVRMKMNDI